jgi:hypothetical protein
LTRRAHHGAPAMVLLLLVLMSSACGSDQTGSGYSSCIDLSALPEQSFPGPLSLPAAAHVTDVAEGDGYLTVAAVANGDVDTVFGPMEQELTDAGFEIISRDYEGFEAEIFFSRSDEVAGVVRIRLGPCPDQVTLSVLYDPLETEGGRRAVEQARDRVEERTGTRVPEPTGN